MKLGVLGLASLLLLTSCAGKTNSRCDSLNEQWNNTMVLLSDLPSDFADKTNDEFLHWQRLSKQKDAIEAQMNSQENCSIGVR